jgi:hypothetical protein
MTRPCGCPADAADHAEIEPDWLGNVPCMHGESDRPVPGTTNAPAAYYLPGPDMYCLCGHPNHLTCPGWLGLPMGWGGGLIDLEIRTSDEEG